MEVVSRGAVRTAKLVWQQRPGSHVLTIACKVTFALVPGTCTLATEQAELNAEDEFVNDDPTRSLATAREIMPCKRHVEVILMGSAHAPRNEPITSLTVRIAVGSWEKLATLHGDRYMTPAGIIRDAQPFVRMPLRYERAAWSIDNPVGMRIEPRNDGKPVALPNIVPVGTRITSLKDKIATIGFGPIAPTWPARAQLLAKTSPPWTASQWTIVPMPAGFDMDFFAIAPSDQRLRSISPDEPLVLEHLHPQHPRLVTRLPGLAPRAIIERPNLTPTPLDLVADTLIIDSDQSLCSVLYRGYVVLDSLHQPGRVVVEMASPADQTIGEPFGIVVTTQATPSASADETALQHETTFELSDADLVTDAEPDKRAPRQTVTTSLANLDADTPLVTKPPRANTSVGGMETLKLTGPVMVAPAMPFVTPIPKVPLVPPTPLAILTPVPDPPAPSPIFQDKPPLMSVEPARIVVKARSSSTASPVDPPRVASGNDLDQLRKRAAASGSAAGFSNAAASAEFAGTAGAPAKDSQAPDVRPVPNAVIELLWFDPQTVEAIRAEPAWKAILEKVAPAEPNQSKAPAKTNAGDTSEKRDLRALLATGPALSGDEIRKSMTHAIDEWGGFVAPLVLLAGDLVFPFDELETLKATLGAVMPFVATDKKLKDTVDSISELLKSPWVSSATGIAAGLTAQLETAFGEKGRGLTAGYLEKHTERSLLERKHYQKRHVFQQAHVRCLLHLPGLAEGIPTYLTADVARDLPAFQRFRVRIIAECHAQVDQHDASSLALKVLALGREHSGFSRK